MNLRSRSSVVARIGSSVYVAYYLDGYGEMPVL